MLYMCGAGRPLSPTFVDNLAKNMLQRQAAPPPPPLPDASTAQHRNVSRDPVDIS